MAAKDPFQQRLGGGFQPKATDWSQVLHSLSFLSNARPGVPRFGGFSRGAAQFADAMTAMREAEKQRGYEKALGGLRDFELNQAYGQPQEPTSQGTSIPGSLPPSLQGSGGFAGDDRGVQEGAALPPREILEGLPPEVGLKMAQYYSPQAQAQRQMQAEQQAMALESQRLELGQQAAEAARRHPTTYRNAISGAGPIGMALSGASDRFIDMARNATRSTSGPSAEYSQIAEQVIGTPEWSEMMAAGQEEPWLEEVFGGSEAVVSVDPAVEQSLSSVARSLHTRPKGEMQKWTVGDKTYTVSSQEEQTYHPRPENAALGSISFDAQWGEVAELARDTGFLQAIGKPLTKAQKDAIGKLGSEEKKNYYSASRDFADYVRSIRVSVAPGEEGVPLVEKFLDEKGLRKTTRRYGSTDTTLGDPAKTIGINQGWSPEMARRVFRDMHRELYSTPVMRSISREVEGFLKDKDLPDEVKERVRGELNAAFLRQNPQTGMSAFEAGSGRDPSEVAKLFLRHYAEPYVRREVIQNPDAALARVKKWFNPPPREKGNYYDLPSTVQQLISITGPEHLDSQFPGLPGSYSSDLFGGSGAMASDWNRRVELPLPFTWSPADASDPQMMDAQEAMARTIDLVLAADAREGGDIDEKAIIENFFRPLGLSPERTIDSRMKALRRWNQNPSLTENPLVRALGAYISPALEAQADGSQLEEQLGKAMQMMQAQPQAPTSPFGTSKMVKNQY